MSCDHDCPRPPVFPKPIWNRPGLDTIDYRIGDYDAMRAHILALIDAAPELAAWTHRQPDDPGIALVEGLAIVGDILAQYQHLYANEAYIRTAQWRESVTELVRVLGYRLAPGLGGRARFALAVRGERPVRIPAGFGLTATLPGADKPATFETQHAIDAHPALSKFHLYRPRHVPSIVNGMDTFQLPPGSTMELAKGDKLLVGIADGRTLTHTQVLVVDKTWEAFGIRHVKTQGRIACLMGRLGGGLGGLLGIGSVSGLSAVGASAFGASVSTLSSGTSLSLPFMTLTNTGSSASVFSGLLGSSGVSGFLGGMSGNARAGLLGSGLSFLPAFSGVLNAGLGLALLGSVPSLRAYKLAGQSRHFGHNAPATRVSVDENGRATEVAVPFTRRLDANQGNPAAPQLRPRQLPLDGEVPEFTAGITVLVEANLSTSSSGSPARKRVLEREVLQLDRQSLGWGGMTGASSVLALDEDLAISEPGASLRYADIRGISVHAVAGEGFTLRAAPRPTSAARGNGLDYFGSRADAQALVDRTLLVGLPAGPLPVNVERVDLAGTGPEPRFFRLTLDQSFDVTQFGHDDPTIPVYGNLVDTTEGKTEAQAVLGDGDARATFQTFPLPKKPLTYLLDTGASPPFLPELEVWVAGVRWRRVERFFGLGPREAIYIVREDDEHRSFVQFGDGRTGARLPTGQGNVVALYRTGTGAHGLAADPPNAVKRLPDFDEAWMLEPATGGAAPEGAAHAREAAPASMQSLGRIVSLADCEAEALAIPGVLKARATWTTLDGTPLVAVTVLTASSDPADQQAIDLALRRALAVRGPARWPLQVRIGRQRGVRLDLTVAADPTRREEDIAAAIAVALGVADDNPFDDLDAGRRGLLHWRMRNFGDNVHGSQVIGAAQNVPGVRWVRLDGLAYATTGVSVRVAFNALTSLSLNPSLASTLLPDNSRRSLRAGALDLLTLDRADLHLRFTGDIEEVQS